MRKMNQEKIDGLETSKMQRRFLERRSILPGGQSAAVPGLLNSFRALTGLCDPRLEGGCEAKM